MAKLPRVLQRIFGSGAGTNQIAKFGSLAAGSPTFSTDVSTIQSLSNWLTGWFGAEIGANSPAIEDMNAFCYVVTSQLAYLFQQGVSEYDPSTTYFYGSMCVGIPSSSNNGVVYVCVNDNSGAGISGQDPTVAGSVYWTPYQQPGPQLLLNGAFDFFNRGNSITASYNATSTFVYGPDRWAIRNMIGASAVVTVSSQTPSIVGSGNACQVQITTAPGSSTSVGPEIFQMLPQNDSFGVLGKSCSFQAHIAPLGNVNQISLQFYGSTEAFSGVATHLTAIGSAVTVSVTTYGEICQIVNQLIPSSDSYTSIGVRIWASGVSSGNLSDLDNGFQIEQAIMNVGNAPAPFARKFRDMNAEILACAAFFSYSLGAAGDGGGVVFIGPVSSSSVYGAYTPFPVQMYNVPTVTLTARFYSNFPSSASSTGAPGFICQTGFASTKTANGTGAGYWMDDFTADAEMY